jgi:xanthine dehydrogenase accessory factor
VNEWLKTLNTLYTEGRDCIVVTVAHTAGSAPREAGTKMLVTEDSVYGTIGGGNLEYNATQTARLFLADHSKSKNNVFLELYALGPMMEQCCGGVVFLHYEITTRNNCGWLEVLTELDEQSVNAVIVTRTGKNDRDTPLGAKMIVSEFETSGSLGELDEEAIERARLLLSESETHSHTLLHPLHASRGALPDISDALLFDVVRPCDFHIALFGAGHVGSAIVAVLEKSVSCKINWVDSRADVFPATLPHQVKICHAIMPTSAVQDMPANSFYLVMTHSHALDQALCEAILKRGDFQYLGLIGSETKRIRFEKRLREKGFNNNELERLICPIGIKDINSKEPGVIAVSVVAQLLRLYEINGIGETESGLDNGLYSVL